MLPRDRLRSPDENRSDRSRKGLKDNALTHAYTQDEPTSGNAATELDDSMFDRTTYVDVTRTCSTTGSEERSSDGSIWSVDTSSTQPSDSPVKPISPNSVSSKTPGNGSNRRQSRLKSSQAICDHPPDDSGEIEPEQSFSPRSSNEAVDGRLPYTDIHPAGGLLYQDDELAATAVDDWTGTPTTTEDRSCEHATRRRVVLVRHGETMAHVFPGWVRRAFAGGVYRPYDLNQPFSVVRRSLSDHAADSPLTQTGMLSAQMTGRGLTLLLGDSLAPLHCRVYASPALSSVQTAHHILKSLKLPDDSNTRIRIEPGLFDWLQWYDSLPRFLLPSDYQTRMHIDREYRAVVTEDELLRRFQCRCETFADCRTRIQRTVGRIVCRHGDHYNGISDTNVCSAVAHDRDNYERDALLDHRDDRNGAATAQDRCDVESDRIAGADQTTDHADQATEYAPSELIVIVGHALTVDAAISGLKAPVSNQPEEQPPTTTKTDQLDRTYPLCTTVVLSDTEGRQSAEGASLWALNRRHALPPSTRLDADSHSDLNSFFQ